MTLLLPGNPVEDYNTQQKFDAISLAWPNAGVGVFSAYRNAALAIATNTLVVFDAEERDASNWFDPTTGLFTPKVAGYYRFNFLLVAVQAAGFYTLAALRKNGVDHKYGALAGDPTGGIGAYSTGCVQAQANGTTDTFGVAFYTNAAGAKAITVGALQCYFQGELIAP